MALLAAALAVLVGSGGAALLAGRRPQLATALGAGGALAGCLLGVVPALRVLIGGADERVTLPWALPFASLSAGIDALSATFLLAIFTLSALAALYGSEYLLHERAGHRLGAPWFFFNLLVASMAVVVVARNAVLFLVAWEVMALASFFLVTFEHREASVREAGWMYLVATRLGTACLLALFVLLAAGPGPLDFDRFAVAPERAGLLFLLAVVGFGAKAGFGPFHVWLPEAHPAAPSHVSAVMSGVMIKTGVYGLLRLLTVLGPPPAWWGWLLCGIGIASAVGGVLFALAQRDLKRLLAYSSVENVGLIALAAGVGLLGVHDGSPALAVAGFAAALLHVLNHAAFKGLLFLAAGAVAQAAGTRDLEALGGLLKRMPWTGTAFLVGAVAIAGLPPLNGFVGEWLLYLAGYVELAGGRALDPTPLAAVIGTLALVGGLAAATFAKAFGTAFLGVARHAGAARACDPGLAMRAPLAVLAGLCVALAVGAPLLLGRLAAAIAPLTGLPPAQVDAELARLTPALWRVVAVGLLFAAVGLLLAGLRRWLLRGRPVHAGPTWDCGYAHPSARMQYGGASFAQPLVDLFRPLLRTRESGPPPEGLFPGAARFAVRTADVCTEIAYRPLFAGVARGLGRLRWLQHGRVHLYVLYISITLLALLVWKLG